VHGDWIREGDVMALRLTLLALLAGLFAAGCARVKPYQRATLAHPAMQAPPWPATQAADQHLFEVREGSRGATGKPGGGCGCN
jgi:hypothetical protein